MSFVIQRDDGQFVAKPGRQYAYTGSLKHARKYTREEAERDCCCENEHVVDLEDLLDEYRR